MSIEDEIEANIAHVRAAIAEAAARANRSPDEITLVAVSKTKPLDLVRIAYNLGVTAFGENRVQEALPKIAAFHPADARWHMIGHLQTNKVGKALGAFDIVESVDSLRLAQALDTHARESGRRLPVLVQVNVSGEESKEGVPLADAETLARQMSTLPNLEMQGLMTIAPIVEHAEEARPVFRGLRELRERLREALPEYTWKHLSMGMTDDYMIAIEEGATIVRVGRAIFGER